MATTPISGLDDDRRRSRKAIMDRLGLPEDASNQDAFAALDSAIAAKNARSTSHAVDEDDAAYEALFGNEERFRAALTSAPAAVPRDDDQAFYDELFGSEK